ncbi:MAG: tetratricopeptide repeat protein [Candidatus Omnitrophica bacterium]|nr:tetratricopeptide repeat protein [Candidatus Omnitrophota bacterium]
MNSFILKITGIVFLSVILFPLGTLEARRIKDIESVTYLQKTLFAIGYEKEAEEIVSLIKEVFPELEELKTLPVEEKIEQLVSMIKSVVGIYQEDMCDLINVLREKRANCVGYSELFYILGKEIGLEVEIILVSSEHVANLIELEEGFMLLDLAVEGMFYGKSEIFNWDNTYQCEASIWHLKEGNSSLLDSLRRNGYEVIQRLDERGILAVRYCHYGSARGKLGLYQEEIANYTRAIELNPDYYIAYYDRGVILEELGLHQEAVLDFNKAIELNPYFAEAYCGRGVSKKELGLYKEAISDFNKAIELSPRLASAYSNRGSAYFKLGLYDEAISDLNKAIELEPDNALAYCNRGSVFEELGFILAAVSDYTKAIEIQPDYVRAYVARGLVRFFDLHQKEEALADFREALRLDQKLYEQFPQEIQELLSSSLKEG